MSRLRRPSALFTLALMLSMMFIGSGSACATSDDMTMGGAAAGGAMADGAMGGMSMPEQPSEPGSSSEHDAAPCTLPWAPGNCHGLAVCAPVAVASAPVTLQAPPTLSAAVAAIDVLAPPSPTLLPELPPPRA